jgi:integrase
MSKLRDGVIKRGSTWSYVVRVPDPETGRTKPTWVGGLPTEAAAKAARDEARVAARRGEYVDRSAETLGGFLPEWLEAHAGSVKPGTVAGYRADIERYIVPRIGGLRLQSLRPAMLSRFYRELAESGGKDGQPLSASTVAHVHRTLRKALTDAVRVEQVLATNPAERAKLPRARRGEPGTIWTPAQLAAFLEQASRHRLSAFFRLAAYTGARRGELLALRWSALDLDAAEVTLSGSTDVIDGERITRHDQVRAVTGHLPGRRHRRRHARAPPAPARGAHAGGPAVGGVRTRLHRRGRRAGVPGHAVAAHGQAHPGPQRAGHPGPRPRPPADAAAQAGRATATRAPARPAPRPRDHAAARRRAGARRGQPAGARRPVDHTAGVRPRAAGAGHRRRRRVRPRGRGRC